VQELEEPGADCHGYAHNDALAHTCNHSNVEVITQGFSGYTKIHVLRIQVGEK